MRHVEVPRETEGYHPLWISAAFLRDASWQDARLHVRDVEFEALYLDCQWLDFETLEHVHRLASEGMPLIMTQRPQCPGRGARMNNLSQFEARLDALATMPNVYSTLSEAHITPLIEGQDLPAFWARQDGDNLILFFANPATRRIRYPMTRGQANQLPSTKRKVKIHAHGRVLTIDLVFPPNQSALLEARRTGVVRVDLG
jgi:hypothetical protein